MQLSWSFEISQGIGSEQQNKFFVVIHCLQLVGTRLQPYQMLQSSNKQQFKGRSQVDVVWLRYILSHLSLSGVQFNSHKTECIQEWSYMTIVVHHGNLLKKFENGESLEVSDHVFLCPQHLMLFVSRQLKSPILNRIRLYFFSECTSLRLHVAGKQQSKNSGK